MAPVSTSPSQAELPASIVVVEDNQTDVFLVQEAIEAQGLPVAVQFVEDGEQAVRYMERIDQDASLPCPRLFLLDLNLPRMSGLEVLAYIRQSERCKSAKVLVMTSSNAERDRAESAALGATAYFIKPSGYEAFLRLGAVIEELLSRAGDRT
jgi:CheY-like chemotaxis protein